MVWVLSQQAGSTGVLAAGAGFVLIGLALWLWRVAGALRPGRRLTGRRVAQGLGLAACLAAVAILALIARAPTGPAALAQDGAEPYSPARLLQLRQAGRPVLVNMTAAWCVTCLVNERAAILPALPALTAHGVAYLTGDWTRQDPAITDFLRRYRRDGVPLYVFFSAALPLDQSGQVLPQILTPGLIRALR
jgi:thiol:disulfide interchange protein DsbD